MTAGRYLILVSNISSIVPLALLIFSSTGRADSRYEIPQIQIEGLTPGTTDLQTLFRQLNIKIQQEWLKKPQALFPFPHHKKTVLRFKVNRNGEVLNAKVTVEVSSGDTTLDEALVTAIRAAAPFAGFPQDFKGPSVELRVTCDDPEKQGDFS
jgi:TonB family protein